MKKPKSPEERARRMAEYILLHYFNRYLYEHGTISEKEYKKMTEKIEIRGARLTDEVTLG